MSFTAIISFHSRNLPCKMARYSLAHKRCLRGWKCPAIGPKAERKRCACLADLNFRIFFSRIRVGWCEFSARLFNPLCCRCSTPGRSSRLAAPYLFNLSVIITRGTYCNPLRSWRKNFLAACLLRRLCDPHIEHVAVLINSSPEIIRFPVDFQVHLVHMPFVPLCWLLGRSVRENVISELFNSYSFRVKVLIFRTDLPSSQHREGIL
jgi:hypothetical protein